VLLAVAPRARKLESGHDPTHGLVLPAPHLFLPERAQERRGLLRRPQRQEAFDRCKAQVKAAGLAGPGKVRVNKAGCLDRCAGGPVAVVYPEAVWYTYVDAHDIDEIVESHLKNGKVVERLLTPAHLGR
jgi:(2Fe-2S) ferredoxin